MKLRPAPRCSTVYIVDPDALERHSLLTLFERRGYDVDTFASGEAFLEQCAPGRAGCLVTDVVLGRLSGLDVQERLASMGTFIAIVFVASQPSFSDCAHAMRRGAIDFLARPFQREALLTRVAEALAHVNEQRVDWVERQRTLGSYKRLRPREKQVLHLLLHSAGAKSSKDVARELEISPRTVEQYRASLMQKMEAKSLTELLLRTSRALRQPQSALSI